MTEALGWIGSALIVASLTQRDVERLRALNLAASVVLVAFNAIVGLPSMVVLNSVLVAVNLYHLVTERRRCRVPSAPARSAREELVDVA